VTGADSFFRQDLPCFAKATQGRQDKQDFIPKAVISSTSARQFEIENPGNICIISAKDKEHIKPRAIRSKGLYGNDKNRGIQRQASQKDPS
jgi:hypothetical protein